MYRYCFSLLLPALCLISAQAQQTVNMSLQNCTDYALAHSYTIKNAQLDVLIQKAQNDQTAALSMPKVSAKADYTNFIKPQASFINSKAFGGPDAEAPIAFSLSHAADVSFSGSQILFDGSVLVALQARNTILELAKQNIEVTKNNLKYNIFKTYNSIVILHKQTDILAQSLGYARSLQREIESMRAAGFVEKIDVNRTDVQVSSLVIDSMRLANLVNLNEQLLKYLMGMDINSPIRLTDNNIEEHVATASMLLSEGAAQYEQVPEYKTLKTVLKLNDYNLKRYQYAALPTLVAFGALGSNLGSNKFSTLSKFKNYESNSLVGLTLSVPVFSGFQRMYQVKEAKLNIEKTKNNIANLQQGLDFQAVQARTSLKNAFLLLQSLKKNTDLANDIYDLARKKYKEGVGSNLEVTQAQTEQLKNQNSYFATLLDIINAEADLKKALGQF